VNAVEHSNPNTLHMISKAILVDADPCSVKRVIRMWAPLKSVYDNAQKAIYGMMSSVASALAGSGALNIKRNPTSAKIMKVRNNKAKPVINNNPLSINDKTP